MISDVCRATIWASEETVMPRTKVAVRLGESTPIALLPRRSRRGVTHTVPLEQGDAVIRRPAVVRRVRDVRLAAEVETVLAFLDRNSGLLPRLVGRRDDADVGAGGDVVRVEFADAGGLVRDAGHAGVDEVVTPVVKADDGAVQGPVVGDLVGVGPGVPGRGTT